MGDGGERLPGYRCAGKVWWILTSSVERPKGTIVGLVKIFVGMFGGRGLQSGSAQNAILLKRRKICARRIYE
jgi:hypothetical protein